MPMFEERYYQNVEVRRLSTERMSAVFPRTHVLAQKPYVTRADLKDENLILACTPESEIGEDKRIIETFWKRGYHPNVVAKIEDVETILLMLSANMGVTILPSYLSIPLQSRGRLVSVPFGGPEDTIDIIAAWMPQTENPSLEKSCRFWRKINRREKVKERGAGCGQNENRIGRLFYYQRSEKNALWVYHRQLCVSSGKGSGQYAV